MSREPQGFFAHFQHKGAFWLPETPDKYVNAVLTHNETEMTLDLFGALRETQIRERLGRVEVPQPTPIIHGNLETGQPCTLYKNRQRSEKLGMFAGKATSSTWASDFLFVGAHISDPATFDFTGWTLTYRGLEEWVGVHPFTHPNIKRQGERIVEIESGYVRPEKVVVDIAALKAKLELDYMVSTSDRLFRSQTWEHSACIVLTPESPRGLYWYMDATRDVQNFFAFCIGEPVYPRSIVAGAQRQVDGGEPKEVEIHVYYRYRHRKETEPSHHHDVLLPLGDIPHTLSTMLNAWFDNAEKLRDVYNLFFGTFYNDEMYLESIFLALIQALETYSRSVTESLYVSESDYQRIAAALNAAIPADTPNDLKQSLKNKLKYGNEYSLRKRLKYLLGSLEPDTVKLICDNPEKFRDRIVVTRNYLTHYTDELREDAIRGPALYYANLRMKLLLTILLCKETGVSDESSIRKRLMEHPKWMQLIHLYLAKDS